MLDPIVLAVIIVLISALGAVFFFMNGSSKPEQKKTVDAPPTVTKPDATSKPARKEEAVAAAPQLSVQVAAPPVSISVSGAGESERDDSADAALQRVQPEKPPAVQREAECEAESPITSEQDTTPSNSSQDEEQRCPTPPPALEPVTEADLAQVMAFVEETEETEREENSEDQVVTEPTIDANAHRALSELKEPEEEAEDEQEAEGEAEAEERVSAYEAAELEEGTDFADASPRASEDFGEGRGSLTLDTSPLPRTLSSSSSSRPNSLQRHDAAARNVSPMRSPPGGGSRQNQNFGSYYSKKGGDSWIKDSSSTGASAAAASPVSVTPVRHSVPRKVIPTSDDQQPLALRQGQKINQYESGLQAEREKVSSRVKETRQKNITDVVARVLLAGDTSQVPGEIDMTQLLADPNAEIKKRTIVKQMTVKFNAPTTPGATAAGAGGSAGDSPGDGAAAGEERERERASSVAEAGGDTASP